MKPTSQSPKLSGILRFSALVALLVVCVVGLLIACSDDPNAAIAQPGSSSGQPTVNACSTPQAGCPCPSPGSTIACGNKATGDQSFIYCYEGTRTCQENGQWGACGEGHITTQALTAGLHTSAAAATSTTCNGGSGSTQLTLCTLGERNGQFCSSVTDCPTGEQRCSGGSDSTTTCNDNSNCQVLCTGFAGHCAAGANANHGCNLDADCPSSTCTLTTATTSCTTYAGICNSSDAHDGNACQTNADCGAGTCEGPDFGICLGGTKNGMKCKEQKHCKGGGTCSTGGTDPDGGLYADGGASTQLIDPCDPYCNVFADTAAGFDAGGGFSPGDGGLTLAGCGDGHLVAPESCDDGNNNSGDGCSSTCKLESGWQCLTPGSPCTHTTCGNMIVEGTEQCDDTLSPAIDRPYDGCYKCQKEVACPPSGPCTQVCGDGIKMGTEECDDGNTTNGDGCSSTCMQETGATCTDVITAPGPTLDVPVIYRDFVDGTGGATCTVAHCHPDFEETAPHAVSGYGTCAPQGTGYNYNALHKNIMAINLDATDREPDFNATEGGECNAMSVNQWYRDTTNVNQTILGRYIRLFQSGSSYVFDSNTDTVTTNGINCGYGTADNCKAIGSPGFTGFFPIDGLGWGNYLTYNRNYGFTSEVRYPFTYAGGEVLQFTGDDDVYVYVAGKKVADLGGIHNPISATVTLNSSLQTDPATGETNAGPVNLVIGNTYEIDVFQAERNATGSNYKLTLQGFTRKSSSCTFPTPPATLERDYVAQCPAGSAPVWQVFRWKANVPPGDGIAFAAGTSATSAGLPASATSAGVVSIGAADSTNSPVSANPAWTYKMDLSDPLNPKPYPVSKDFSDASLTSQQYLRVFMTFTGPAIINEWQQLYDCIPDE